MFVVALVLTVTMFGWQGNHLYGAYLAASHKQAGDCATKLVEAVYFAGERQTGLVEDLEHEVLVFGHPLTPPGVGEWKDHYTAASDDLQAATDEALAAVGEGLASFVGRVDETRSVLNSEVENILDQLSVDGPGQGAALLTGQEYLTARADFSLAVDGLVTGLATHLETKVAAERRDELVSVGIAIALFTAAIGAWAVFGRRIRRGHALLAGEQQQRLEAEAELLQAQKMEALGLMADGVAHDVNNLTAIIRGSAREVRMGLPEGQRAVAPLDRIEDATRQADDVAKALLAFSRKAASPRGPVDLAALVHAMTPLLNYMVPAAIELVVEAPVATWVYGDAVQLEQAVFNLVANANDAMPQGGTLTILVRSAEVEVDGQAFADLVIQDTGEGIPPELVRRLFEPFFTTRPAGQGTGLGLSIVHGIVTDHGGRISVSTRPAEGSTFSIELPMIPAPAAPPDAPGRNGTLVLVANPDAYVREVVAGALATEGYRTVPASSLDEVRGSFGRSGSEPVLAVVDSRLAAGNDFPVPAGVPVILTGHGASVVDLAGRQGSQVLGEPLSLAMLTRTVADILRPSQPVTEL
jgi:signal transduction histidine kinase